MMKNGHVNVEEEKNPKPQNKPLQNEKHENVAPTNNKVIAKDNKVKEKNKNDEVEYEDKDKGKKKAKPGFCTCFIY